MIKRFKSFKKFLSEAKEGKNYHLEHLEDNIINNGVDGANEAISLLSSLGNKLLGTAESDTELTTKWDGAPAIICGINPENNKFFVATKSAFAKNPKLMYTEQDVIENYSAGLAHVLTQALNYFKNLGIHGILQGDLLYTKETLHEGEIDGENCYYFTPNTITYAVPVNSKLGEKIGKSKIGIVFHTTYSGNTIADIQASFGADISGLKESPNVWVTSATFKDESGVVKFTHEESVRFEKQLNMARGSLKKAAPVLEQLRAGDTTSVGARLKIYFNSRVRENKKFISVKTIQQEFEQYYTNYINNEIEGKKTDRGKEKYIQQQGQANQLFEKNREAIYFAIATYVTLHNCKNLIINKLNKINTIKTLLRTDNGFTVTAPEGFVAIKGGKALKLVDRFNFSQANFNMTKNWAKDEDKTV